MPRTKGPKIRELAELLGIPAHALLERCRAGGIDAQNTITRLTGAQEVVVRSWFPDAPAAPAAAAPDDQSAGAGSDDDFDDVND